MFDQLLRSRQAVSLAMPWRPLLEWGRDAVGNAPTRLAISLAAAVLAVGAGGLPAAAVPTRHDCPARSRKVHLRTGNDPG